MILLLALLWAARPAGLQPLDEAGYRKLIASQHGHIVLVDFWATWCEPCREEMPRLVALAREWRQRGVVLLTISADEPEQARQALDFLVRAGVPLPAWRKNARSDEHFINAIDPKWSGALPALFLYGRHGRKAASFIGETEISDVVSALRKLL